MKERGWVGLWRFVVLLVATAILCSPCSAEPRSGDDSSVKVPEKPVTERYINTKVRERLDWIRAHMGEAKPISPSDVKPPENVRGVDPIQGAVNNLVDDMKIAANLYPYARPWGGGCVDLKMCGLCLRVWPPTAKAAWSYRWPVSKMEVARQPFQSNYIPKQLIALNRERMDALYYANKDPGMKAVGISNMARAAAIVNDNPFFKAKTPLSIPSSIEERALTDLETKVARENRYHNWWGDSVEGRSATYHLFALPKWQSLRLEHMTIHKPRALQGFGFYAEFLNNFFYTHMASATRALPGYGEKLAAIERNPALCTQYAMQRGEVPSDMLKGFVEPPAAGDTSVCLKYNNGPWLPFTEAVRPREEPLAAAVTARKGFELSCATDARSYSFNARRDKVQYIRGHEHEDITSYSCTDLEKPREEYGKANFEEQPAEPFTMVHWKYFAGCPEGFIQIGCEKSTGGRCGGGTSLDSVAMGDEGRSLERYG